MRKLFFKNRQALNKNIFGQHEHKPITLGFSPLCNLRKKQAEIFACLIVKVGSILVLLMCVWLLGDGRKSFIMSIKIIISQLRMRNTKSSHQLFKAHFDGLRLKKIFTKKKRLKKINLLWFWIMFEL
ncbi:MAG: hypothetical protein Q8877_03065 [Sweet potato little leaf phytoplasma]|nr:hypothetical protein [Sweet potato little leaf phytoplasma]